MRNHQRSGWQVIEASREPRSFEDGPACITIPETVLNRLEFLADGSSLLSSSLDYEATLANVVRCAVPFLADWCFLQLQESDGSVRRVSWAMPRPQQDVPGLSQLLEPRTRLQADFQPPVASLASTVPDRWLDGLAASGSEAALLRRLRFQSAIRTPLPGASCPGALTFLSMDRPYATEDLELAVEVSHRAAVAIGNAQKHAEAMLRSSAAGQAQRQERVFAVLNHELRNLLAPILGWAKILRDDPLVTGNAILAEGAESLSRNARHMARLVDDCLEMSRGNHAKVSLDRTVLDLNEVMLAAVEAVREAAWEKRQSLLVELASNALWVDGDYTRLQQVAMNILGNAVRYTGAGGRLYVRSLVISPREAEIEVADSGKGIEADELERIFEPFHQSDPLPGSGLGLGLAISRQIITLHKGCIWAESQGPGCGASIRFRLPLAPAAAPSPAALCGEPVRSSRPCRILMVEDAPDVRALMKIQVEAMGHHAVAVADAWGALSYAREHRPDLVICDIKLSGLDGYSLIQMLRSEPETAAIPVLAVTGASARETEPVLEAGAAACLCKPVEDSELSYWIERLTESCL